MKQGMGVGQVFIFIMVGITFAVIMLFGYRAITDFLNSAEEIGFVQFKTELESSVKRISSDFGSVRVASFHLPAGYMQVCFVDLDYQFSVDELADLCRSDPAACTAWETAQQGRRDEFGQLVKGYAASDENVFLQPSAPVALKIHPITIDGRSAGALCTPIHEGNFQVRLEGKGSFTDISSP